MQGYRGATLQETKPTPESQPEAQVTSVHLCTILLLLLHVMRLSRLRGWQPRSFALRISLLPKSFAIAQPRARLGPSFFLLTHRRALLLNVYVLFKALGFPSHHILELKEKVEYDISLNLERGWLAGGIFLVCCHPFNSYTFTLHLGSGAVH